MSGTAAYAVPVTFEFSGVVDTASSDLASLLGSMATGRITYEIDGLLEGVSLVPTRTVNYISAPATPGPSLFTSQLSVAGDSFQTDNLWNNGRVNFFDGCTPTCPEYFGEAFALILDSRSIGWNQGRDATFDTFSLTLIADQPLDSVTHQRQDYFDSTAPDFGVMSAITLPLHSVNVGWSRTRWECVEGRCTAPLHQTFSFNATTVTRTVAAVPEPATLGLLCAGLLGAAFLRRRRHA